MIRGSSLQNEIGSLIQRFARQFGINSVDDLVPLGLNPTLRQKADLEPRTQEWNHFWVRGSIIGLSIAGRAKPRTLFRAML